MARPKEPLIEVDRVIEEALSLIDEVGLGGLNMRELGKRLGVNPASLYHHFRNKEAILDGVREHIMRKGKTPSRMAGKSWDEQLMILGKRYRSAMTSHPNALVLVTATNPIGMRMMAHHIYDGVVAAMLDAGFTAEQSIYMMVAIETMASGSVMEEVSMGRRIQFGEIDRARYPSLYHATRGKPLDVANSYPDMLATFIEGAKSRLLAKNNPRGLPQGPRGAGQKHTMPRAEARSKKRGSIAQRS